MEQPPAHSARDVVLVFLRGVEAGETAAFELVAEDFVQHAAGPQGREGLKQTAFVLDHDLGPGRVEIHNIVAKNDTVMVHLTLHGRHRASTMPLLARVPVTERPVSWTFVHVFRVAGGTIREHWACRDDLGLLVQLGAWPEPGAPST